MHYLFSCLSTTKIYTYKILLIQTIRPHHTNKFTQSTYSFPYINNVWRTCFYMWMHVYMLPLKCQKQVTWENENHKGNYKITFLPKKILTTTPQASFSWPFFLLSRASQKSYSIPIPRFSKFSSFSLLSHQTSFFVHVFPFSKRTLFCVGSWLPIFPSSPIALKENPHVLKARSKNIKICRLKKF